MSETVRRLRECVDNWPGCYEGGYDPSCCRFPKSCSCEVYDPATISEERLESDEGRGVVSGLSRGMTGRPDDEPNGVTWLPHAGDLAEASLMELRRIADALESIAGNKGKCYGETDGTACVLPPDHVGHHVSADGRLHWLDKE